MRQDTVHKIKGKISQSTLSIEDKASMIKICERFVDEDAEIFLDLIEYTPSALQFLSNNRKQKEEVFASNNNKLWKKILSQEHKFLSGLDD